MTTPNLSLQHQDPDLDPDPDLDLHQLPCNIVTIVGTLVEDAEFFTTRSGKPKISFRVAIPRSPDLPRKKPSSEDFFTVTCYGKRFVPLLDALTRGRQVVVVGWAQSRDLDTPDGPRVVNEIGARAVIPVLDPSFLPALDAVVTTALQDLSPEDCRAIQEALTNSHASNVEVLATRGLLRPDGQIHPEIRLSILRVLERQGGN